MSPRRARRREDAPAPLRTTGETVEQHPDGDWVVRPITGSASVKVYRCPGCDQEIRPATPHVVAWPVGAEDERRHWHSPCWVARNRRSAKSLRPPGTQRRG